MDEVFVPADALWRGLGTIPQSGLAIREDFADFDAVASLGVTLHEVPPLAGCRCGEVLKGKMAPDQCPLFAKACTPATPVGPCMARAQATSRSGSPSRAAPAPVLTTFLTEQPQLRSKKP